MRLLITGGAGTIGTWYRRHVGTARAMRLFDRVPAAELGASEMVVGELSDRALLETACQGMDAVLHLAGLTRWDDAFESELVPTNIIGLYNVYAAAHAAGCKRVVFASSVHTTNALPDDRNNLTEDDVFPGNMYGVTKCYGEDVARYYAYKHGMSCVCLRFGMVNPPDRHLARAFVWEQNAYLGPRDLCQIIDRALDADVQFAIVNASSNNQPNCFDLSRARTLLGYEPQESFAERLAQVAAREG